MNKLIPLLASVVVFQLGLCEIRDNRHFLMKLGTVEEYLDKSKSEVDAIDGTKVDEKETLDTSASDFLKDIVQSITFLNRAVADNTRNNEFGKTLYGLAREGKELAQWAQDNLKGDTNTLQINLKIALDRYSKIVKIAKDAFPHLKEATENPELANNSLLDFIDNSFFLYKKLFYHLKFKKFTNGQITDNIKEVLGEAFASLEKINSQTYTVKELEIHSRQLNYFLQQILVRLNYWARHASPKQAELKRTVTETAVALGKIADEIQHVGTKSVSEYKTLYKNWLNETYKVVKHLDAQAEGKPNDIVIPVLFDTVGIAMNYKGIFSNLAGVRPVV